MATASATAIAFNGNGVFLKNCPYFVQAHKKDVPSFPVWCLSCHKKIPNVRPVLNPKGHAKAAFWADWNAYSPSLPTCTRNVNSLHFNAIVFIAPLATDDAGSTPIFILKSANDAPSLVFHVTSSCQHKEDVMISSCILLLFKSVLTWQKSQYMKWTMLILCPDFLIQGEDLPSWTRVFTITINQVYAKWGI